MTIFAHNICSLKSDKIQATVIPWLNVIQGMNINIYCIRNVALSKVNVYHQMSASAPDLLLKGTLDIGLNYCELHNITVGYEA